MGNRKDNKNPIKLPKHEIEALQGCSYRRYASFSRVKKVKENLLNGRQNRGQRETTMINDGWAFFIDESGNVKYAGPAWTV